MTGTLVLTPERLAALEALRWMVDAVAGRPAPATPSAGAQPSATR